MSKSTVVCIGRDATLATRSATVPARSRSASEISQWRAVMIVSMPTSRSAAGRAVDDVVQMGFRGAGGGIPVQALGEPPGGVAQRRDPSRAGRQLEHAAGQRLDVAM